MLHIIIIHYSLITTNVPADWRHANVIPIYKYKESQTKFGIDNYENAHTFNTFTCDNNKIVNLENSVNSKFDSYVRSLNFKRRKQVIILII